MAAAAQGLIHRDLKPGNIMLTPGDATTAELEVKVIDFGLAKAIADAGGEMDLTHGGFVGTPTFASPEQFGSGPVDARADIYSLGATLWFALTGLAPRSGSTIEEIRGRQTRDDLPVEQLVARKVPAPLIKLLRRTLAIEPAERPASARELMEALESCRRKLPHRIGVFYKLIALIAVVAIAAATLFVLRLNRQKITSASARNIAPSASALTPLPEKSIAVLPFLNMSADKGDEYLSDGVSEELIAALTKITGLQVKARTSSFAFKGKNEDIQQIGELLHVSYLLEGSVARAGNKLRITAQLIQASDGNHLWSDTYDREMQDIFAVRSEVAQQVAQTLKIRLLGEDKKRLDKKPTENIEAYNLYRQGRYYAEKFSQDGFKKALGFYQQAIEKDPHFALAYAGMADNYVLAADLYIPPREAFPKAKEAALKAIELDDNLAEAHASLGFVHFHYDWDWVAAENEFKRALALNPQSAQAHIHYTDYLVGLGRFNEAYDQGRHALEIDPVSPLSNLVLGWAFLSGGRIDDAIQQFSKAVELNPNDVLARTWLGRAYLTKGMAQRAIEEMEVAHRGEPDEPLVLGLLGYGYAVTGRRADALKTLETLDEMEKKHYVSGIARVYVYAGLGDKDKAFEWLEKAYQERSDSLAWFRKAPESKSLQADPRFAVLMRKIGFTEP
jgi:serine/threonine-protein kinase